MDNFDQEDVSFPPKQSFGGCERFTEHATDRYRGLRTHDQRIVSGSYLSVETREAVDTFLRETAYLRRDFVPRYPEIGANE